MQPTFLPWAGYFRMITEVDKFVFLDDVQLTRRSWQTRNRVLVGERADWISVPVLHAGQEQKICETEISDGAFWRKKMARKLRHSYAGFPERQDLEILIECVENGTENRLDDLNISLIDFCMKRLEITTPTLRSSSMTVGATDKTGRLIAICKMLNCESYLSPLGSAEYLEADGFRDVSQLSLQYTDYVPPLYPQYGRSDFVSHLSIVDVIANLGWMGTADYIRAKWGQAKAEP